MVAFQDRNLYQYFLNKAKRVSISYDQYPLLSYTIQWSIPPFFFFRTLSTLLSYAYTVTSYSFFFCDPLLFLMYSTTFSLLHHWFPIHLYFKWSIKLCFRWTVPPFLLGYLCEFVLFMFLLYHPILICQHIFSKKLLFLHFILFFHKLSNFWYFYPIIYSLFCRVLPK